MGLAEAIIVTVIAASTPLLLAAIGELVAERSGVLNLGVEGMMIMGAASGFGAAYLSGSPIVGLGIALLAGVAMAALFGLVTQVLVANQVATGLALTILGLGLSGLVGEPFVGVSGSKLLRIDIPGLTDLPFIGPILFGHDPMVYLVFILAGAVSWFLFRTRGGLIVRAVGDSHSSAHALGYSVMRVRFLAVLFGGACAGLAGGYLSVVYSSVWIEGMSAGRGWIALALVVFATWMPGRLVFGALLFGAVGILQLHAQALGVRVPSQFMNLLPYLMTMVVLVLISGNRALMRANTPASLGLPFTPER